MTQPTKAEIQAELVKLMREAARVDLRAERLPAGLKVELLLVPPVAA